MNERFICVYLTVHEPQVFISSLNRCHNTQQHNYNPLSCARNPITEGRNDIIAVLLLSAVFIIQCRHGSLLNSAASAQIKPWTGWMELSVTSSNQQYSQESFNCLHCSLAQSHIRALSSNTRMLRNSRYTINRLIHKQTLPLRVLANVTQNITSIKKLFRFNLNKCSVTQIAYDFITVTKTDCSCINFAFHTKKSSIIFL